MNESSAHLIGQGIHMFIVIMILIGILKFFRTMCIRLKNIEAELKALRERK
jgi:hypothetical protein